MNDITSIIGSLKILNKLNKHYTIPAYQRLYVWGKEQIEKFLNDIIYAFEKNEEEYFIGNIILVDNNNDYDIVDGQQRFTTLFLLLKVIYEFNFNKNILLEKKTINYIKNIIFKDKIFILKCFARKFANNFFNSKFDEQKTYTEEEEKNIEPLDNAYQFFLNNLNSEESKIKDYNKFVYYLIDNVRFAITIVPLNTDVNQLFETMNSTSVQLEQHQVLKAKILSNAKNDSDYGLYTTIWDFVANMNSNIINSKKKLNNILANLTKNNIFENAINNIIDDIKLLEINDTDTDEENNLDKNSNNNGYSVLTNLLKIEDNNIERIKINDIDKNTIANKKSIINFPYFLLHTLRLFFLFNSNDEIKLEDLIVDDTKLIKIFDYNFISKINENNHYMRNFFTLLIITRYYFDKFVIKWSKEELELSDNFEKDFFMLQTMLYHSQSEKRYWLTPILYKIISIHNETNKIEIKEKIYNYLLKTEHILYNTSYCSEYTEARKTLELALEKDIDNIKYDNYYNNEYLQEPKGTKFPHYIFYKLEFIIYYFYYHTKLLKNKNMTIKNLTKHDEAIEAIKEYKIMSRNSIEHIIPQSSKEEDINIKDSFGNLVLLSVSINSSYSNKEFNIKRAEFYSKLNKNEIDSLKSLIIYTNEIYKTDNINKHLNDMINLINNYHEYIMQLKIN